MRNEKFVNACSCVCEQSRVLPIFIPLIGSRFSFIRKILASSLACVILITNYCLGKHRIGIAAFLSLSSLAVSFPASLQFLLLLFFFGGGRVRLNRHTHTLTHTHSLTLGQTVGLSVARRRANSDDAYQIVNRAALSVRFVALSSLLVFLYLVASDHAACACNYPRGRPMTRSLNGWNVFRMLDFFILFSFYSVRTLFYLY